MNDLIDIGNKILKLFNFDEQTIKEVTQDKQSIKWSESEDDNYLLKQILRYLTLLPVSTLFDEEILSGEQIQYIFNITHISYHAAKNYKKSECYRNILGIHKALESSSKNDALQNVSAAITPNSIFK